MQKIKCPLCGGDACQISYGKLAGTTIGILIGVTSTVLACFQKTKVSEDFFRLTNKALRSVIDHTLALLANVSTGGFIGQQAGDLVDENLIRSYRCLKCKHRFRI